MFGSALRLYLNTITLNELKGDMNFRLKIHIPGSKSFTYFLLSAKSSLNPAEPTLFLRREIILIAAEAVAQPLMLMLLRDADQRPAGLLVEIC